MNPYNTPLLHRRVALHMDANDPRRELRRESFGRAAMVGLIWLALGCIFVGVAIPFIAEMMR